MVHVQTGNELDVVYDFENDRQVLKGLSQHGDSDKLIPLRDPQGLINVLQRILSEIESQDDNETNARR